MPAHLRFQSSPWATHHVVSRCIQGYGFLKPTQQVRKVIRGIFAYSADLFCRSNSDSSFCLSQLNNSLVPC
jgi:hypothetical protein